MASKLSFAELLTYTRSLRQATPDQFLPHVEETLQASALKARRQVLHARVAGIGMGPDSETDPIMLKPVPDDPGEIDQSREGARFIIPIVIPEGIESGDGRLFQPGSLSRRELPLPLLWQTHTGDAHDGSVVVGRIDNLDRTSDGMGNAYGVFDTGPYAQEAERLVRNGMLRFVSADLDKFEADVVKPDEETELADIDLPNDDHITPDRISITKGRVMGITLVAKPAFQECTIELMNDDPEIDHEVAEVPDGVYEAQDALAASAATLCAAVPVHPPQGWFEDPKLQKLIPLTVDDSGRVYGHIASWDMDHIGMPFGTRVPSSRSKYAYFHTGVIRTEEGKDVPVGQLTLSGGHAPLSANAAAAIKHYDDTKSAIADVRAGEDAYGVWVSGALRSDVTPEQVRAFRASSPSGDWRSIRGGLELVAVCQVNVPGFPVARAQVASGAVLALVAAGTKSLTQLQADPRAMLEARIRRLETAERRRNETKVLAIRNRVDPLLAERRQGTVDRVAAIRARMDPLLAARKDQANVSLAAAAAAQRSRLNEMGVDDYLTAFKNFSPERRNELAAKKHSLPDGSFPIENESDLKRAIQAYGRASADKKARVRRHIIRRARGLGKSDLIPDSWNEASMSVVELFMEDVNADDEFSIDDYLTAFKDFSPDRRKKLAQKKHALPDGSFPIENVADLKRAVKAYGRTTPDKQAKVRRHIIRRARGLGKPDLIPDGWNEASMSIFDLMLSDVRDTA